MIFRDRTDAGKKVAERLTEYSGRDDAGQNMRNILNDR